MSNHPRIPIPDVSAAYTSLCRSGSNPNHGQSPRYNDNAPPPTSQELRDHSPFAVPFDFSHMLAAVANKKSKLAPLYEKRGKKEKIRLRALQHMIVCHLRRQLAVEVKLICDINSATSMQMKRIRKFMKDYDQSVL
jgi:hypothetical protein